jgi:hypothetical protein
MQGILTLTLKTLHLKRPTISIPVQIKNLGRMETIKNLSLLMQIHLEQFSKKSPDHMATRRV